MRCKPTTFWCMLAAALSAFALTAAAEPLSVAQASDEEEDALPAWQRGVVVPGEAEAPEEREEKPLPRMGASRRPDPFDTRDEPHKAARSPAPASAYDPGAVVCEAGCDGPKGTVVYKKKQPTG